MSAIYNVINNVIQSGNFNAESLISKIETLWVQDKLTDEEKNALTQAAYDNARDLNQIDIMAKLAELHAEIVRLDNRIIALENPGEIEQDEVFYEAWTPGHITSKGEILWYDHDNDGEPSLFLYDGGRVTTTLGPGKISGWYILDPETLQPTHTYYKGIATEIVTEQEETEPESTEPAGEEPTEPEGPTGETGEE